MGIIAIAQNQDAVVRLFTDDGHYLGSLGGRGKGPGEMTLIERVGWKADTLWISDPSQGRVTLFDGRRRLVRTLRYPTSAELTLPESGRKLRFPSVRILALLPGDTFHATLAVDVGQEAPEAYHGRSVHALITETGIAARLIVRVPIGQVQLNTPKGESFMLPFPNRVVQGVSVDDDITVFAQAFIEGEATGTILVTAVQTSGDTVFARHYPVDLVEIPAPVRDSVARRTTLPIPSVYPPLAGLIIGSDRSVWIELNPTPEGRPYMVLGPTGDQLGSFMLPTSQRIGQVRGDWMWSIDRDSLGVESVVKWAVGQIRSASRDSL
jgi:hypothetical protein